MITAETITDENDDNETDLVHNITNQSIIHNYDKKPGLPRLIKQRFLLEISFHIVIYPLPFYVFFY